MKVEIYGQMYNIQGEQDEAYVRKLAQFVDERMRSVAEATRTVDSVKVAVLAALNLADELSQARERSDELEGPLKKRVERCVGLVERALEQSS
ncbi:MAG: cell division protein ZapA [Candidatus Acidiferrales bacterium]